MCNQLYICGDDEQLAVQVLLKAAFRGPLPTITQRRAMTPTGHLRLETESVRVPLRGFADCLAQ
jgi:hypothetical protein